MPGVHFAVLKPMRESLSSFRELSQDQAKRLRRLRELCTHCGRPKSLHQPEGQDDEDRCLGAQTRFEAVGLAKQMSLFQ
jgi:3-methyladenine DNA glycosylase AlkC